ncbi:MAG: Ribosomal RNA small subunit methyltransferase I [Candidatus Levybacteria bacterium GW2011_GWA2_36_13]|nr:MAG: Ribosomal RNA small subunit methyltransferase I [Candidatus Levybacteria bacterium GW2011_GWA2_36_13]
MGHLGTLYIVATPIGNLQDITLRAIRLLKETEYITCEDTRKAHILLKSIGAEKNKFLISYFEGKEDERIPKIINLLKNGKDVALISDAGTPGISDPGFRVVRSALNEGIAVRTLPGPSAGISGLVISGLPTDKFIFLGFPPQKGGNRKRLFTNLKEVLKIIETTVIIYESPHKILRTLKNLEEIFGDIEVVIERELTKIHEEVVRAKISEFLDKYSRNKVKGELMILFSLKRL